MQSPDLNLPVQESLISTLLTGNEITSKQLIDFGEMYVSKPMGVAQLYRDIGIFILEDQTSNPTNTNTDYENNVGEALTRISRMIDDLPPQTFTRTPFCYKSRIPLNSIAGPQEIAVLENIVDGAEILEDEDEESNNSVNHHVKVLYRTILEKNIKTIPLEPPNRNNTQFTSGKPKLSIFGSKTPSNREEGFGISRETSYVPLLYDLYHLASRQTSPVHARNLMLRMIDFTNSVDGFLSGFKQEFETRIRYSVNELLNLVDNLTRFGLKIKITKRIGDIDARYASIISFEQSNTSSSLKSIFQEISSEVQSGRLNLTNYFLVNGLASFGSQSIGYWGEPGLIPTTVYEYVGHVFDSESNRLSEQITNSVKSHSFPRTLDQEACTDFIILSFFQQREAIRQQYEEEPLEPSLITYLANSTRNPLASFIGWRIINGSSMKEFPQPIGAWLYTVTSDIRPDPNTGSICLDPHMTIAIEQGERVAELTSEIKKSPLFLWEHGEGFQAKKYPRLNRLGISEIVFYPNWESLSSTNNYRARITLQEGEEFDILFTLDGKFYYLKDKEYKRFFIPHIAGTQILETFSQLLYRISRIHTAEEGGYTDDLLEPEEQEIAKKPNSQPTITRINAHLQRLQPEHNANIHKITREGNYEHYLILYSRGLQNGTVNPNHRYTYVKAHVRNQPGANNELQEIRYH